MNSFSSIFTLLSLLIQASVSKTQEKQEVKQFIVTSIEDGVITSAKSTFRDTIFYECRYPDTIKFCYVLLTHKQNEDLKKQVSSLTAEESISKFELYPGMGTFVVESNQIKLYKSSFSHSSRRVKKIIDLFKLKASDMKSSKKIVDFWNIDGIVPPPLPSKKK